MHKYNCYPCGFKSNNKYYFERHCNSNKHVNYCPAIEPIREQFECDYCDNVYSS